MKLIVNNILKDLYMARVAIGIFLAMVLVRFVIVSDLLLVLFPPIGERIDYHEIATPLAILTCVSMFILTFVIISAWMQMDSLNDDEAFWVTRPAREKHLFISKLASLALVFFIVPTIFDVLSGMISSAGWNSLWAIPNNLWICGIVLAPVLFIASVTRDLARMLLVATIALFLSALWIGGVYNLISGGVSFIHSFSNWEFLLKLILIIGLTAAYVFQSLTRNRSRAIKVALATVVLAPIIAIPRLTHHVKTAWEDTSKLENISIEAAEYVHNGWPYWEQNNFSIQRNFKIIDSNPNRILLKLKTESELTTDRGGRQRHSYTRVDEDAWSPSPFLSVLENSGYIFSNTPTLTNDHIVNSTILAFDRGDSLEQFSAEASLNLNIYFSEYELVSIADIDLGTDYKLSKNKISSVVYNRRLFSKESGIGEGMRLSIARISLMESQYTHGFNSMKSYTSYPERSKGIVRVYFLYDSTNHLLSVGFPQFNKGRNFYTEAGNPFFGPNNQRRHKNLTFNITHDENIGIEFEKMKLIAMDIRKIGISSLSQSMTLNDLPEQISAFLINPKSNSKNERWRKVISPE